jgi:hypothetical protein
MSGSPITTSGFDVIFNSFVRLLRSNVSLALEIDQECITTLCNEFHVQISAPENPAVNIMEAETPTGDFENLVRLFCF